MPASPKSNTTCPSPFFAFDQRRAVLVRFNLARGSKRGGSDYGRTAFLHGERAIIGDPAGKSRPHARVRVAPQPARADRGHMVDDAVLDVEDPVAGGELLHAVRE
ncbi:MAG TPA: hypothetical protein VNZ48_16985, partial [Xanthobacteraceae bacterium]|nr:hypothetical protein [Xanthobacteraceae bacterium]